MQRGCYITNWGLWWTQPTVSKIRNESKKRTRKKRWKEGEGGGTEGIGCTHLSLEEQRTKTSQEAETLSGSGEGNSEQFVNRVIWSVSSAGNCWMVQRTPSPNHALLSPLQGNVQTCLQELTSCLQAGSSARGRYGGNRKLLGLW